MKAFLLLFLISLSAHAGNRISAPTGFEGALFHNKRYLSDFSPKLVPDTASRDVAGKLKESATPAENAKALFDHYCQGGKPRRRFSEKIKLILPKPEAGLPLDLARTVMTKVTDMSRNRIHSYYVDFAYSWRSDGPTAWGEKPISTSADVSHSGIYFFGIEKDKRDEVTESFKDARIDRHESTPHDAFNFLALDKSMLAFYGDNEVLKRFVHPQFEWKQDKLVHQGYFLPAGRIFTPVKKIEADDGQEIYPLSATASAELSLWSAQYVLLPSQEEAKKLVPEHAQIFADDNNERLSNALSQKDLVWREYLRQATNVKEEPTKDPQIMNYEVELDLSGMCEVARPAGDFVSR